MVAYIDFICPVCKRFESTYNEALTSLRNEGKISLEYRPLGLPGPPVQHQLLLTRSQRRRLCS